jgi:predicted  nucleic acid-binding Zn-ribbon protein
MQHLQIKTLQQQCDILTIEVETLREDLDAAKEENKRLQERKIELEEDCRELRRQLEQGSIPEVKIKTEFTQSEIDKAMEHDP